MQKRKRVRQWRQKKNKKEKEVAAAAAASGESSTKDKKEEKQSYVYLLRSLMPASQRESYVSAGNKNRRPRGWYVGFSVDPVHRLRQHNGEIAGGAEETEHARPWEMVACVTADPSWFNYTNARALEWRLQRVQRLRAKVETGKKMKVYRKKKKSPTTEEKKDESKTAPTKEKKKKKSVPIPTQNPNWKIPQLSKTDCPGDHTLDGIRLVNDLFWLLNFSDKGWTKNSTPFESGKHHLKIGVVDKYWTAMKTLGVATACRHWSPQLSSLSTFFQSS